MTYVDELESDFSVFHRLDIWGVSFARLIRLAPKLPAYQGALRLAMERDAERAGAATAPVPAAELSTDHPQVVDSSADTPDYVVAQLQQRALAAQFESMGVHVTGIEPISDDEMERLVNSG